MAAKRDLDEDLKDGGRVFAVVEHCGLGRVEILLEHNGETRIIATLKIPDTVWQ